MWSAILVLFRMIPPCIGQLPCLGIFPVKGFIPVQGLIPYLGVIVKVEGGDGVSELWGE